MKLGKSVQMKTKGLADILAKVKTDCFLCHTLCVWLIFVIR